MKYSIFSLKNGVCIKGKYTNSGPRSRRHADYLPDAFCNIVSCESISDFTELAQEPILYSYQSSLLYISEDVDEMVIAQMKEDSKLVFVKEGQTIDPTYHGVEVASRTPDALQILIRPGLPLMTLKSRADYKSPVCSIGLLDEEIARKLQTAVAKDPFVKKIDSLLSGYGIGPTQVLPAAWNTENAAYVPSDIKTHELVDWALGRLRSGMLYSFSKNFPLPPQEDVAFSRRLEIICAAASIKKEGSST